MIINNEEFRNFCASLDIIRVSTHGKCIKQFWPENLKERDHLENIGRVG
jgi:hypothetical protein